MANVQGWGIDPFGTGIYGSVSTGNVSLAGARAISTHEVEVTVTGEAQDNSPFLPGDALNPSTWAIQRLDDNSFLPVVNVQQTGTYKYVLLTLEEFGPVSVTHTVSSSTLRDGGGALITAPRSASFLGITDASEKDIASKLASQKHTARDYANPPTPDSTSMGGTLQITSAGDYQTVTGPELLKKLIIRRLISRPGDFFHLPKYGIGLRTKEPLPAADLPKLKVEIQRQVMLEPDVQSAQVQLLLDASKNILFVNVTAQLRPSGEVSVGVPVPVAGVVL